MACGWQGIDSEYGEAAEFFGKLTRAKQAGTGKKRMFNHAPNSSFKHQNVRGKSADTEYMKG
jgi:hypothetical protein